MGCGSVRSPTASSPAATLAARSRRCKRILPDADGLQGGAGKVGGFSLHAGVAAEAHQAHKLETLCRYITRPAISEQRLSISVRYELKTPWRNGTTHVDWDAVDFIAKLAALVPPPRAHLTRFHEVFAPKARLRAQLTPSAPSSATSSSMARGKMPTTGQQHAHRQCKPRDDLPAAQPAAKPESKPMRPRSAGRHSACCRESARIGHPQRHRAAPRCRTPTHRRSFHAQNGAACTITAYPADCPKRGLNFPYAKLTEIQSHV